MKSGGIKDEVKLKKAQLIMTVTAVTFHRRCHHQYFIDFSEMLSLKKKWRKHKTTALNTK